MPNELTRRELMRSIAAPGLVVAGTMIPLSSVLADQGQPGTARGPQPPGRTMPVIPAKIVDGKVVQPQRELSVLRKTSFLIVGGGPAGTAAALSARRFGIDVTLVERHGYLGGLATGGLVLPIFPLYDRKNRQVIAGIGILILLSLTSGGIWCARLCPLGGTLDLLASIQPLFKGWSTCSYACLHLGKWIAMPACVPVPSMLYAFTGMRSNMLPIPSLIGENATDAEPVKSLVLPMKIRQCESGSVSIDD